MKSLLLILTFFLLFSLKAISQLTDTIPNPEIKVTISLIKDKSKLGEDIQLTMILLNGTKQTQSVWFDRPRSTTGGPAWTSVILIDKTTGKSVLKYENKGILESQAYTTEQIKSFSYHLKPGQSIKRQFSLYDMVVTNTENNRLSKGTYEMKVFYVMNQSNTINFTVD